MGPVMSKRTTQGLTTKILHTGYDNSRADGAITPPIHLTSTFVSGNPQGYEYGRSGNPTRDILEATLAALDGASFGLAYSSGSAALANIVALLSPGEKILFSTDAYGGTYRYIVNVAGLQNVAYGIVDLTDLASTKAELATGGYKLIWVETPSNPMLKLADILGLANLAHAAGALLVVDNTFATPALQQPLALGADIVAYSTTKYINGHSDSVGGAVTLNHPATAERLRFLQNAIGAIMSPFDAWLTLRGLRTLELRMQRHCANATSLAKFLNDHPSIDTVYYPGLFTGEQGKLAQQQLTSGGGIISLELKHTVDEQKFIAALTLIPLAESLGAVESLLDHPASMTHASIPKAEREKIGLSDKLFRLSVGIENLEDLQADLGQALDSATS